jgi:hypothetical protein
MTKNSFKKSIQERYKGRGNSWVKVLKSQEGAKDIEKLLSNVDSETYMNHTDREGFYWIRFSKVEGTSNETLVKFEVRYKGSKIDHPESTILINDDIAKEYSLLGNTPVKLQLEVDLSERKTKAVDVVKKHRIKNSAKDMEDIEVDIENEVRNIKESVLTKPSDRELELWYEFLKLNNLYEENV